MNRSEQLFLQQCGRYMQMSLDRILLCIDKLEENEIWESPNKETNSVGNLVAHLEGNIRQYIISGLGGIADNRQREREFDKSLRFSKSELKTGIDETITEAINIISSIDSEVLQSRFELQGFEMSGLEAVLHVTEHLSYHTGQIALLTKMFKNEDLGFYKGMNLNKKNQ